MTAPAILLLLTFLVIPICLAFWLAFTNARLVSPAAPQWTGEQNFERLLGIRVLDQQAVPDPQTGEPVFPSVREFTRQGSGYPQYESKSVLLTLNDGDRRSVVLTGDPAFWKSLRNTLAFALVVVPVQGGLGLALALLVNRPVRGVNLFRTIYFMPVVTSLVVVSILWRFLYQSDGLVNSMLGVLTFGSWDAVRWLDEPGTALGAIMLMSVWQGVGFHMVIWLAGLQTIPGYLYEAAAIDGASASQRFRHVTLPGLRPTLIFVVVTITLAALGLFVQVDVMTQGGPLDATTTVVFHAVRKGFREQEIGYAAAISLVFFFLVLAIAQIQRRLIRDRS
ncbi:MAG TPA: ABC transporter permease [Micromonosporaceae bacterium]|nr:ABC transporter permease [Micromonosporaceae bacterium]HCU52628.1 ABC transporter permease [Micromonosporaceae bacterium]